MFIFPLSYAPTLFSPFALPAFQVRDLYYLPWITFPDPRDADTSTIDDERWSSLGKHAYIYLLIVLQQALQ